MLVFALPHHAAVWRTEDAALGMACGVGNGRPWALVLSHVGQPDLLETPTPLEFWGLVSLMVQNCPVFHSPP